MTVATATTKAEPTRAGTNPAFGLRATAVVLGASSLGINFYNTYWGGTSANFPLEDGVITINGDVLKRDVAGTTNTAQISDTHLLVKETNVYKNGDWKWRRYVCIPIPAHP